MAEERGCGEGAGGREEREPCGAGAGERGEERGEGGGVVGSGGRGERREVRVEGLRGGGWRGGGGRVWRVGPAGDGACGGEAGEEEEAGGGGRWGHGGSRRGEPRDGANCARVGGDALAQRKLVQLYVLIILRVRGLRQYCSSVTQCCR